MKDVRELFADLTRMMEDIHSITVEGQRADLTPDMQSLLLAAVRDGVERVRRIMLDIAIALP